MYREVKGNLLKMHKEGHFDYICHGANCQKIMGGGIALQISRQFPLAYEADKMDMRLSIERLGVQEIILSKI